MLHCVECNSSGRIILFLKLSHHLLMLQQMRNFLSYLHDCDMKCVQSKKWIILLLIFSFKMFLSFLLVFFLFFLNIYIFFIQFILVLQLQLNEKCRDF